MLDKSVQARNDDSGTAVQTAGATPMMEQYIEIKAANPGSLLFYRMGDFYELFFQDAEEASRALGITLTKRGKHLGQDIPMCGVPVHAAEDYLQKLISMGFRVSVCEQTEDPAEAKKRGSKSVVRREVIRLVTPGTITEEKLLDPARPNHLAALARIRHAEEADLLALAWIDLSTGQFRVCESSSPTLAADLARVEPSELVYPDSLSSDDGLRLTLRNCGAALTPQPAHFFDSQQARQRLETHFDVGTLEGFGNFSRVEVAACGAILSYVEKTQIGERPALSAPVRETSGDTLFIDAATRANLELVKTLSGSRKGALLSTIDRTVTGGGARLLGERMMNPLTKPEAIALRQDCVAFFLDQPRLAEDLRAELKRFADMPRALSRLSLNRGGPRDLGAILAAMRSARDAGGLFGDINTIGGLPSEIASALDRIHALPAELEDTLGANLDDELPLLKRDGGFVRPGAIEEIDDLRRLRDDSRRVIAALQQQYADSTGVRSLKIRHNNVLGYFIEVTAQNAGALQEGEAKATYIHRQTLANNMRFTTTELSELESKIANAAGRILDLELARFEELQAQVLANAASLQKAAQAVCELDVAAALATLAREGGWCRPHVDASTRFEIAGGRHPVVERALRADGGQQFVANDCNLGTGESGDGELWLVTGPNMGGKSTFLRQNALIAILAQMGAWVPAETASLGVVDRLFSRVGAADDLARGRSTFMVEMVETAAILNQATPNSLVILDEIGRGTATFDGLSIAWATIEHLHEVNRCRTLFATHFHELTALSQKLARITNVTIRVKEWEGEVIFLHEVVKGVADRSYGIQVARLAGLPDAVVARARDVLDQLEQSRQEGHGSKAAQTLIDELPLFSAEVKKAAPGRPETSPALEALAAILPDDLSPREALEKLYELKSMLKD